MTEPSRPLDTGTRLAADRTIYKFFEFEAGQGLRAHRVLSLRDAMDIDRLTAPALYFGTTTGQLWIGRGGGEKWDCLFDSLPPIHNIKVAVV